MAGINEAGGFCLIDFPGSGVDGYWTAMLGEGAAGLPVDDSEEESEEHEVVDEGGPDKLATRRTALRRRTWRTLRCSGHACEERRLRARLGQCGARLSGQGRQRVRTACYVDFPEQTKWHGMADELVVVKDDEQEERPMTVGMLVRTSLARRTRAS